jgi:stress-induced morphogen
MVEQRNEDEAARAIKRKLLEQFARVDAYRYNSASIRVRVVDPSFAGMSRSDREKLVFARINELPEGIQSDITMLVLLEPDEKPWLLWEEFENPTAPSL